jgi:hypothetical protein
MRVEIGEVASSVQMMDSDSLLDERTLARIVAAVLQALDERDQHDGRAAMERGVSPGIARGAGRQT